MSDESTPDQRQAILDAAIAVLQDDGAAALTVRRVASGAGCSTTGVYTWFGGKGGLVDALYVEGFERFDAALDAADHDLVSQARAYRRWGLADSTYYLIMFGSAVPGHEPSEQAVARSLASFDRLVRMVNAELGPDHAGDRAYHLWATIHGYVMLELQGLAPPLLIDADAAYERAIELVLSSVR
ncbi:MAG: TetR/AcrR family transcriptional regulator [Actinomycetota bacterium]